MNTLHPSTARSLLLAVLISVTSILGAAFGAAGGGEEGGIGGTGLTIAPGGDEGGIGGTGIVGVITGFGSIIVNGVHVDYTPETPVDEPFGTGQRTAEGLKLGQVVEVTATRDGLRYRADAIRQRLAVAGPITEFTQGDSALRVIGQEVVLSGGTIVDPAAPLYPGSRIAVSGLWDGTRIRATRIDPLDEGFDLVSGPVRAVMNDTLFVGDVAVRVEPGAWTAAPEIGGEATFLGQHRLGLLAASRARTDRPFAGIDSLSELVLDGYPQLGADGLRLYGIPLSSPGLSPGVRAIIRGRYGKHGGLRIQAVAPPDPPQATGTDHRWQGGSDRLHLGTGDGQGGPYGQRQRPGGRHDAGSPTQGRPQGLGHGQGLQRRGR